MPSGVQPGNPNRRKTWITIVGLVCVVNYLAGTDGWSGMIAGKEKLPYQGEGSIIVAPDEMQWSEVGSMPPGAKITVIEGDVSREAPFTARLKLPADYRLDPHVHPAYERVTVLSGKLFFARGETFDESKAKAMSMGSFAVMPPGTPMYGFTKEPTVIQIHGTGPWAVEYINPADDPRR